MDQWITVECERALYVDFGINVVACDRLPSGPVTLLVKLSGEQIDKLHGQLPTQRYP